MSEFNEDSFHEDVKKSVAEDVNEDILDQSGDEPEYSEIEQDAIGKGWRPDGVEGKRNLSAEEFLDRQKLYDEIKHLKNNTKAMQKSFDALAKHHKRVAEAEREKIISDLKLQKRLALEADDYDRIMELDDKILEAHTAPKEEEVPEVVHSNEAFENWSAENRWYTTNQDMRDRADVIGKRYFEDHPGADLNDVYAHVTKKIKDIFPENFGMKERKPTASAVDTGARRTGKTTGATKKYSARDLPEEDFAMMKTIVRTGAITEEQYLKEYFESA